MNIQVEPEHYFKIRYANKNERSLAAKLKQSCRKFILSSCRQKIGQIRRNIHSFYYYGRNVHCPFCKGNFRHFLPYGVVPRPNSRCPRCGSLERYRLLYLYLKNRTTFFSENLKVLDIGPTYCFSKLCRLLSNIEYISIDISSPIALYKMNVTDIRFEDSTFDCLICYHVLEHVKDDALAMRELFRVLKPGGWALIQVPIDINRAKTFEDDTVSEKDYLTIYGQSDHVRIYGLDFKHKLESVGFRVRVYPYMGQLSDETIRKYGLGNSCYSLKLYTTCEDIYFCSKTTQ